jgi:WD40 repeat protein
MGGPVSITSSAPSVAAVNANGEVTTFGSTGNLTLTVRSGALQAQVTVQVADFKRQSLPGEPFGVAVSVNDVAYVAALSGPMGRINLPNPAIVHQVPIVGTTVIFDATGTRAYVAGFWGSGLPVIDVTTDSIVDSLGFFYATRFDVERSADGQKTFVGTNSGLVAITNSNGTTVDVPVGSYVNHLSRHPTLPLIYATQPDLGRVVEINTNNNAIVRSFQVASGMVQATGVSANGNRLFIANESGEMGVWDLVAGTVLPSVKNVGNPFGLSLSPDGSKIYLSGSGVVRVLSASTLQVLTTFVTGGTPRAVAFNQAGTMAVSANQAGWVDFLP